MKSNFFKIVLPAFALMLAITASLAFTPAENNEEANQLVNAFEQISQNPADCLPTDYKCWTEGSEICKITALSPQLFGKNIANTRCDVVLYKPYVVIE